ncbi:ead/Ea22-like family protein [Escherichia coli]|uniref:ead/Ea22-like family protein n=1 Tax=Escherichia coli TaxID=562 RepID=UPI001CDA9588|nr:ead/Ea22-like family protein [Escherichia coli]
MTIDYQALREAAEKATCGEWSLEYGEERFDAGDALIHREAAGYIPICRIEGAHPESGFDEDFQMEQQANAEFIAAANPATVLALLGELEAAKKRIAELEAELVSQTYKLNELSGNSPVTPDGWISCSERMPEMGERQCYVLAADFKNNYPPNIPNTQVGVYGDWFNDGNPTWDDGDGEDLYLKEVTHWMPLPEPPQEVNRG